MTIFKRCMLTGLLTVLCGTFVSHAQAATELQDLDCRHLFAEDVRVSDQIIALRKKKALASQKGVEDDNDRFFVKFDPIPGIGVMNGMTLVPEGRAEKEDISDERLDSLRKQLGEIKVQEERKVCPSLPSPLSRDERLLDDQMSR